MDDSLIKLSYWVSMLKQETDCSICLNTLKDPVTTSCFHTFCKTCITRVIRLKKSRCPLCKKQINHRNTEINNKVRSLIDKINPIIKGIKNESAVDILSYYKGKTTALSLERLNSSRTIIGEDYPDTRPFVNQNLTDINHVSVSQNFGQDFNSEVSALDTTLLKKIPFIEKVKTPSKKVKDWLSENEVQDCSSPFLNQSFNRNCTSASIENMVESKEIINDKTKLKDQDVLSDEQSEFYSSEISQRRKSYRRVYQGMRPGYEKLLKSDEWSYLEKSKNNIESELQTDNEIQDSCPVQLNDTFDKLILEVRKPDHTVLSQEKSEEAEEDEIGLFESLPLPAENVSFKRKRGNMFKLLKDDIGLLPDESEADQNMTEANKKKCLHKVKCLFKENVDTKFSCVDIKSADIGLGKSSGGNLIEKCEVNKSLCKGKTSHLHIQEKNSPRPNSLSRIGSKNNSLEVSDFTNHTPKTGRKKLLLSLQSHDWSCVKNACKDFNDSKNKIVLNALDVSGGDPCNTSISKAHISNNVQNDHEIQEITSVPSFLTNGDMEKPAQQIISTSKKRVPEKLDKSLLPNSNEVDKKKKLKKGDIERIQQAKIPTYEEKLSHRKIGKDPQEAFTYGSLAKSEVTDMNVCRTEGMVLLGSSAKNKSVDLQKVRSPKNKKIMSHDPVVEERKTFLLNSSTQDLSKLADNIERESTEDQLASFSIGSHRSKEEKSPVEVIAINVKEICNAENEVREQMLVNSKNCDTNDYSKLSSLKKHKLSRTHTKSKPVVPIIKLGKLKSKQPTRVKYLLLGRMRHSELVGKMTSEVCIGTEHFTPKKSLPGSYACSKSKKFTEDHHIVESKDELQSMHPNITFSHKKTSLKLPDRQVNKDSENDGGIVSIASCHEEEKIGICQTVSGRETGLCSNRSISHVLNKNEELYKDEFLQEMIPLTSEEVHGICEVHNDESGEVIPSTERSGPRKLFVNKLKNACSSYNKYLKTRKNRTSSRKLVCQLFDENPDDVIDIAETEMAHPIVYSQMSMPCQNKNEHSKKPKSVISKNSEDINLFSDSLAAQEIDHGSQIKRIICNNTKELAKNSEFASVRENLKIVMPTKMVCLENGIQSTPEIICTEKETPSTIELESSDEMRQDNEDIDDEVLARKDEQIIANIEADLKSRENKKNEGIDSDDTSKDGKSCTLNSKQVLPVVTEVVPDSAKSIVDDSDLSEKEESDDKMTLSSKKQKESGNISKIGNSLKDDSGEESDCIVESSPRSLKTIKKYIPTKRCPISLVASGLSVKDVNEIKLLVERLNLHFNHQFCCEGNEMGIQRTTHVIAKTDSDGKTFCTFKYLCGVLSGCWILSMKWVTDCLSYGRVIEEEPYEVLDAFGGNGPYKGRHSTQKLFNGFEFMCKGPFNDLTEEQMKVLIELGGGKVISIVDEFSKEKGKCLAIADGTSVDVDFNRLMQLHDVAIISYEWVFECVEEISILPLINFVVNLDVGNTDIRNKLLKMGYPEELTRDDDDELIGRTQDMEEFEGKD